MPQEENPGGRRAWFQNENPKDTRPSGVFNYCAYMTQNASMGKMEGDLKGRAQQEQ